MIELGTRENTEIRRGGRGAETKRKMERAKKKGAER